jgi:tetratricopeptide (TPR) repeat protein
MLKWKTHPLAVIAALSAAVLLPLAATGYSTARRAESELQANRFESASYYFQRAARLQPWHGGLWEKAGLAAFAGGDFPDAIALLNRAPNLSEQGWSALGYSHVGMGDLTSAVHAYQRGLQHYDSPALYAALAFVYREQKDWDAERSALENQIRLGGGDAYAHYRLGLLLCLFDPERAYAELQLASSLNPEVDPAAQTLRSALNLSTSLTGESRQMTAMGRALGLVQEWELALAAFQKAVAADPRNAEAWAWLGEAKQQTGLDGGAELDRAASLDRTSVVVRGLRALHWSRQERYPQMLAEYLLAAEFDPENPAWQAGIGDAHAQLGDLVAALAAYQRAVELAPADPTYWRRLAVFCAENGVHLEEIGLPAAQQAVLLAPQDALAWDALGLVYFSTGRFANAEQALLKAIELAPRHFPAHLHLALNYLAQGNRAAAFNTLTFVRDAEAPGEYRETALKLLEQYFP